MLKPDIKCPFEDCPQKWAPGKKTTKNDIQHHLYMTHNMEVIESHKVAEKTVEASN